MGISAFGGGGRDTGSSSPSFGPGNKDQGVVGKASAWVRRRILGVALSAASFITLVSLIAPAWMDFLLDMSMIGLIALVGKLARREK